MFKKLKISHKLIIIIAINISFLCIIGLTGLYGLTKIFNDGQTIYNEGLTSATKLSSIKSNFIKISLNMQYIINPENQDQISKYENNISELVKDDDALMSDYEEAIQTVDDEEYLTYKNEVVSNLTQYRSSRAKVLELCNAKNYVEAKKIYDINYTEVTIKIENGIDKAVNESIKSSKTNSANSENSKNTIVKIVSIAMLLGGVISCLFGVFISKGIINKIKKVVLFTEKLGNGDLSEQLEVNSNDELDEMITYLNKAISSIRTLVEEIIEDTQELSSSSEELTATSEELLASMTCIKQSMDEIAKGNESLSLSTSKVSDATESIENLIDELDNKAQDGEKSSNEIKERAISIKNKTVESSENINKLYSEKEVNIKKAIEEIEVRKEIVKMAEVIGKIADQTNLLSLNSMIESAKAGEQGKGFSVVASEIKKLADQSAKTVVDIRKTVDVVNKSINNFIENTNDVMDFIDTKIKPDYKSMISNVVQYEKDSEIINEMSKVISVSTKFIKEGTSEVNDSVQDISTTMQETASSSESVQASVHETTIAVEEVTKMALSNSHLAEKLTELTHRFKI